MLVIKPVGCLTVWCTGKFVMFLIIQKALFSEIIYHIWL